MKKTRRYFEQKVAPEIKKRVEKDRKMLDADVSYKTLFLHAKNNFLYGFCNGIVIAFVTKFINEVNLLNLLLLCASYVTLKLVESEILNREKYTTKFGKKYVYPIPSMVGFVLGAYISTLI